MSEILCKKCGSLDAKKNGKENGVQTYKCKNCNSRFRDEIENEKNLSNVLLKIEENYTPQELRAIASGGRIVPGQDKIPIVDFSGKEYKFCSFTDTHIGSIYFKEENYLAMLKEAKKQKVDAFFHSGDVTEGMSNRPDHMYELSHIGYEAQKKYAISLLSKIKKPLYMISGNHDRWFIKSCGANIVKDIADAIPNAEFVGHDTGIVSINGCNIQLWHGLDGNSYAISYRIQKVIESLTGGTKPNVLLCGHTHKYIKMFERNIHAFGAGCLELQTSWMRGKRLSAHTGFSIITLTINKGNVVKCNETWHPFYM